MLLDVGGQSERNVRSGTVAFEEFAERAFSGDDTVVEDHETVGERLGFVHVGGGQHDRDPEFLKAFDHRPRSAPRRGVEAGEHAHGLIDGERREDVHVLQHDPVMGQASPVVLAPGS
ncbi:MAG: hypothetical protein WBB15_12205 [Ornithinimicrobium sp.]